MTDIPLLHRIGGIVNDYFNQAIAISYTLQSGGGIPEIYQAWPEGLMTFDRYQRTYYPEFSFAEDMPLLVRRMIKQSDRAIVRLNRHLTNKELTKSVLLEELEAVYNAFRRQLPKDTRESIEL